MLRNQEQDKSRPALILMFGSAEKKYRVLDKDAVVIGRARGCDIGLDAPDVSGLHCVIWRGSAGLQVRDCASRAGTRLNGDNVQEAILRDGDVLQIGPFSFRVYVPPSQTLNERREAYLRHLDHSRRNLGQLAVNLRRKLRELGKLMELSGTPRSLQQKASGLRARVRDYEQRAKQLDERERDLARDRLLLDEERAAQARSLRQAEEALARRLAQLETDIEARANDFQPTL